VGLQKQFAVATSAFRWAHVEFGPCRANAHRRFSMGAGAHWLRCRQWSPMRAQRGSSCEAGPKEDPRGLAPSQARARRAQDPESGCRFSEKSNCAGAAGGSRRRHRYEPTKSGSCRPAGTRKRAIRAVTGAFPGPPATLPVTASAIPVARSGCTYPRQRDGLLQPGAGHGFARGDGGNFHDVKAVPPSRRGRSTAGRDARSRPAPRHDPRMKKLAICSNILIDDDVGFS
jgi:hypothetical protein